MSVRAPSLAFALCLGAVFAASGCRRAPAEEPPAPIAVSVATVSRTDVPELLSIRGRLVPPVDEDATLAPQVAGRLVHLAVRAGDDVRRGALLAEVDRAPLEEADATAAAALAKARQDEAVRTRTLALTERLLERGIASSEERDGDRAALEAARAARVEAEGRAAQAARQRGWAGLRAPFDGVVAQVLRHPGEAVDGTRGDAGPPAPRDLGHGGLGATRTSTDLSRVKVGDEVAVTLPGWRTPVSGARDPRGAIRRPGDRCRRDPREALRQELRAAPLARVDLRRPRRPPRRPRRTVRSAAALGGGARRGRPRREGGRAGPAA